MKLACRILGLMLALSSLAHAEDRHKKEWPPPDPSPNPAGAAKAGLPNSPPLLPQNDFGHPTEATTAPDLAGAPSRNPKQTACAQKHSLISLAQIPTLHSPQAVIGGVYFLADTDLPTQLYFMKSPGLLPEPLTHLSEPIRFFHATKAGDKVALMTETGSQSPSSHLYLYDRSTNQTSLVWEKEKVHLENVFWENGNHGLYFTANLRTAGDLDLYRLDLESRKETLVVELAGLNQITDVSPSGNRVAMVHWRSFADSDLIIWDKPTGKMILPSFNENSSYFAGAKFTADSDHLFVLTDQQGGFRQVHLYDLKTNQLGKSFSPGYNDVDFFELDFYRQRVLYVKNENGYSSLGGYSIDSQGRKGRILLLPRKNLEVITAAALPTENSKGFFLISTTSNRPTHLWFATQSKETPWTQPAIPDPLESCFKKAEAVVYPSFDGILIHGFLFEPDASKPNRTALYLHDEPAGAFRPTFQANIQYWLERGFSVFAPNVRGSSGYGRNFLVSDDGPKRFDSVRDVLEGAKYLVAKNKSRVDDVFLRGTGYGGYLALRALQTEPQRFAGGSVSFPVYDWVAYLNGLPAYSSPVAQAEFGRVPEQEAFLKSHSPLAFASRLTAPALIFEKGMDPVWKLANQFSDIAHHRNSQMDLRKVAESGTSPFTQMTVLEMEKQSIYFFLKDEKEKEPLKNQGLF